MAWRQQLKGDPLPWLLEADSPGARYLALRDLLDASPDDAQLRKARRAAHKHGPIAAIMSEMDETGYWVKPGPGYSPKYRSTVWSMIALAQLGASVEEDKRIGIACRYLLDHALTSGGQFTDSGEPAGTMDCLQGNLYWAVMELGYADPRLDTALEWMARSVTGEGVAPSSDREAAVRYYNTKCGPGFACRINNRLPCAWGAVKVMLGFSQAPAARRTPLVRRAIEQGPAFLLGTDPATALYPFGYGARPSPNWFKLAFPVFYVTDLLQNVEALARLGYGRDPRLRNALAAILAKQDDAGRWPLEYDYTGKTFADFGPKKKPNKWVTIRALRVLKGAGG